MSEAYRFAYEGGVGELVEKKSRFIATVTPVTSEEEALRFIEQTKKKYWDARHNCTAFTIGSRHQLTRCSDDGEPAGTAGRPMLDVLLKEDIHNVAGAVQEGLRSSVILTRQSGVRLEIRTDYTDLGKIQYLMGQEQIPTLASDYTDSVYLEALVPVRQLEPFCNALTEGTAGKVSLTKGDPCDYALNGSELLLLNEGEPV